MIPQIIQLGPIPLNSFGLMVALSLLAAIYRLSISFKINGLNPHLAEKYVLTGGLVGLVGARLWYIGEHFQEVKEDLIGALLASGGFTFYGGFIIACLVLAVKARIDKVPFHAFVDAVGPALSLGYAIGRLGCQLSGDGDYGRQTDSFLGMSYATGVVPTAPGILHLPTPLFESTISLAALYILTKIETKSHWQKPYRRFAAYLILLSIERFIAEVWRDNPRIIFGFSEAQLVASLLFTIGLVLMCRSKIFHGVKE